MRARGRLRRRRGLQVIALVLVLGSVVLAAPASRAEQKACGGRPVVASWTTRSCSFVATGTRVSVQATFLAPVQVTYSLLTPVFPGAGWIHAKLMLPNGAVVAECEAALFVASACRGESPVNVAAGTRVTCWMEGNSSYGSFDYLCTSRNPVRKIQ